MRLYLVRHGQTHWNAEGRAQGHSDIPLDSVGLMQADQLRARFEGVPVERVWTSDLMRAQQTADGIVKATGSFGKVEPALRERGMGVWEGRLFAEIRRDVVAHERAGGTIYNLKPEGGESVEDVWERLKPVAAQLVADRKDAAVVTHGMAASVLLAHLLQGSLATSRAFHFRNASVTELEYRPEGAFRLVRFDDVSHLPPTEGR